MLSKFFIDRPIFATVLSVLIVIAGLVSMKALPIAQFPEVVPPSITISTVYPGADAKTVADTVAAPIEQQLSGATDLLYFQSTCTNDGRLSTVVTFNVGRNLDLAQVDVQNRVNQASPRLPEEVRRQGVTVLKKSANMVQVVVLSSTDPAHDQLFLSNYATINLLDAVKRVPGIGDALIYGAGDYAMRVWLNPDKLAAVGLTVTDVKNAINEQNGLFAAGQIGQRPGPKEVELTVPVTTRGRLDTAEDFAAIILRSDQDGSKIRLSDVGRVELGSQSYDLFARTDGKPATLLITYLQDGANALDVSTRTRAALDEASKAFPAGMTYTIPFDTTLFISESIHEVVKALRDAVILVLIVVFIFLQNWRATLIPLLAIPVSIIGTFAGLMLLGFSINTLTLFALVLAIGIVVDDAIVVVENVERIMAQTGKNVRDSTIQAMEEVSGPVVAIVLVLCAVFIPVAFLGGLTGRFYQQFALTIAVSVVISGVVALTLSPALCRLLLKPHDPHHHATSRNPLTLFFKGFNWVFDRCTNGYIGVVRRVLRFAVIGLILFGGLLWATADLFKRVPSGFVPGEDMGYVIVQVILPQGASLERTDALVAEVEAYLQQQPAVANVITMGGMNFLANGSNSTNAAAIFVPLHEWSHRKTPELGVRALLMGIYAKFKDNPSAMVLPFNPPPVPGLGTRVGIEFQLQDRSGGDLENLGKASQDLLAKMNQRPEFAGTAIVFNLNQPQLYVDVDREQIKSMGLPVNTVFETLQAQLGSLYINDFTKFGRVWKVQIQAEPEFRKDPAAIGRMYVKNQGGEMLPLSGVVQSNWKSGANMVTRFTNFPAVTFTAGTGEGISTGEAMAAVESLAQEIPGVAVAWSGASLQERMAGSQAGAIMGFGLIIVFLVLCAQYESIRLPFAVMLAVPLGIFGAMLGCFVTGLPSNIYVQIGLLVLIGLAAKNAILIVEFAAELQRGGMTPLEAAIESARLRFRPILMTSFAFILGVVPLILTSGAGAAGRISMGIGVFGGMTTATVFAVLLVPLFYRLLSPAAKAGAKAGTTAASGTTVAAPTTTPPSHP